MQNPMAFDVEYREHIRQTAWVNANDWQIELPGRQHRMRRAVATALLALADALTPSAQRDPRTA
jgi:surfactin synthase thioesterase subunit